MLDLVEDAVRGQAGTLLVAGEAGVGKTALVGYACTRVSDTSDVLWGSCLPLTSQAVPFLPLTSALRAWSDGRRRGAPGDAHDDVLPTVDGLVAFDSWLDAACEDRPLVLVVDDLQWADQSTLDALMYVVAGPRGRRLAVIATTRTGDLGEGEQLRRWLADVRRLPGFAEMRLGRLDRVSTGELIAELLGRPPHQTLVDDVFARTQGNAYLSTLLVRHVSPDAMALPPDLPGDLREAVALTWHGLTPSARELTRLVAVAGRPQRADQLQPVAAAIGLADDVTPSIRAAVDAGVLEVGRDGTFWFPHPLLAEVLENGLIPEQRRAWHAAFAVSLASRIPAHHADVQRVVALADHHHRAGNRDEAFRWALLGAESAEHAGGATETLRLLRRSLDLWPRVPDPGVSRAELLGRLRATAEAVGDYEVELVAVEELLALEDADSHPLRAAEWLVRRMQLRLLTGREFAGLDDVREAVRLSSAHPDSGVHALAIAELAHAELWHAEPSGRGRADDAVRLARANRSAKALSYALSARAIARVFADSPGGLADAEEAQRAAAEVRDFWAYAHATLWACNSMDVPASREPIDHLRRSREELGALGAPHTYVAILSSAEAAGLLMVGDWRACVDRLRVSLGSTPGPVADSEARLIAALLASRQGRPAEAAAHLTRAEELSSEHTWGLVSGFHAARAELAVAVGDTTDAVRFALAGAACDPPPRFAESLIPLAARAIADEVQQLRDLGGDATPALDRLHALQARHPTIVLEAGPGAAYKPHARAMQSLYDAELLRGHADPGAGVAWEQAAGACAGGGLAWDETYAWWRAGQAFSHDRSARGRAAAALRRAHRMALDLEAAPLLAELESLARSARLSLAVTADIGRQDDSRLPGLTPREREVLAHVVAGRTYSEIAGELVVSEKTVSVHVSNLLRKTRTANRVELSQLAHRLAKPGSTARVE